MPSFITFSYVFLLLQYTNLLTHSTSYYSNLEKKCIFNVEDLFMKCMNYPFKIRR
jgi:hypothetical protein